MSDPILLEINDGTALITLNRPNRLNALNYDLIDRLMAALDVIETDASVRAVILTGAGERAFSAGADIHEFSESVRRGRDAAVRDFVRRGQAMTARSPKPSISPSPARKRVSQNRKSISACRRHSAERNGCRGSPGASARWSCC